MYTSNVSRVPIISLLAANGKYPFLSIVLNFVATITTSLSDATTLGYTLRASIIDNYDENVGDFARLFNHRPGLLGHSLHRGLHQLWFICRELTPDNNLPIIIIVIS
jgi:hypothetical protein